MNEFIRRNAAVLGRVIALWHFALAFAAAALLAAALVGPGSLLFKALAGAFLAALGTASVLSGVKLVREERSARLWSFAVNYVGFVATLVLALQAIRFFLIIDKIAERFGQGFMSLAAFALIVAMRRWSLTRLFAGRSPKAFRVASAALAAFMGALAAWRIGLLGALLDLTLKVRGPVELGLILATAITGLSAWILHSEPMQRRYRATLLEGEAVDGFLFLTPNLLGFLIFFAGPLLLSLVMSFYNWDVLSPEPPRFIGLGNYVEIFSLSFRILAEPTQALSELMDPIKYAELTRFPLFGRWLLVGAQDPLFWKALGNTLAFALMSVPASVALALVLANVLNSDIPGMKFFRVVFFIPSIAAIVGVAMIWKWLYHGIVGFINHGLAQAVALLNAVFGAGLVFENVNWLSNPNTALFAIAVMAVWQTVGFNTVLYLAGLQNIPKSIYEAGTIDGAGPVTRFFKLTLPLLGPTTFFVVATSAIQALQLFEQVYIATSNPQTVNNATLTVVFYLYQNGFMRFRQGYASATAWALFLIIFAVTFVQYRRQKATENLY
jgi:ABC-type sugar transport system permease subunit